MPRINLREIPWDRFSSPSGRFRSACRNISLALGGIRNVGVAGGGHPFDLQVRRIPPGASICPHHAHYAQWELFVILGGRGLVRAGRGRYPVRPGDVFVHPPGEAHQIINPGRDELEVLIIADNPPLDACYYPDSEKWGLRPPAKIFRMQECNYFDGEDEPPAGCREEAYRPPPLDLPKPSRSFFRRCVNIRELVWEHWSSPKGKYRQSGKDLSGAVGDVRNGWPRHGHPFNLELVRVPAGKSACPFHAHFAQWELFFILQGRGQVRAGRTRRAVGPGDLILHPPGEAHELINTGRRPLECYIVADNPPVDYWHYPDSDKWGFRQPYKFFRTSEVPFTDGEE